MQSVTQESTAGIGLVANEVSVGLWRYGDVLMEAPLLPLSTRTTGAINRHFGVSLTSIAKGYRTVVV